MSADAFQIPSFLVCSFHCNLIWLCLVHFSGNYVLNYLATRPKLATFVTQALIQLYARITKLGWFDCQKDEYVFRNVITDVTRFLQVCGFSSTSCFLNLIFSSRSFFNNTLGNNWVFHVHRCYIFVHFMILMVADLELDLAIHGPKDHGSLSFSPPSGSPFKVYSWDCGTYIII